MKQIIILLLALCGTVSTLSAQQLTVRKSEKAAEALSIIDSLPRNTSVQGYRIGLFFDNGQEARTKATLMRDTFVANFPTEPVYMVYQSPYYKVSAGDYLTEEEAIVSFEKIRKVFPNAYVMREVMEITHFVERNEPLPVFDSTLIVGYKPVEATAESK